MVGVVYVVLQTAIVYQVAERSFRLIGAVPDRVTRWFGASDGADDSHHVSAIVGTVRSSSAVGTGGLAQAVAGAGPRKKVPASVPGSTPPGAGPARRQRPQLGDVPAPEQVATDESGKNRPESLEPERPPAD